MKKHLLLLTCSSLLLLGAGCARTNVSPSSSSAVSAEQKAQVPIVAQAPLMQNNSITAEKQVSGERVNIANVQLAVPGFVEIHEDASGKPGAIIGKSELFTPAALTVTVQLQRPSKTGETLYAMLHGADNVPLKDVKGAIAVSTFTIVK